MAENWETERNPSMRHSRVRYRNAKKWIKGAIKRPGALRKKLTRWYGLKKDELISPSMLNKAYKRAKSRGDTRTMRQVTLARRLKGFAAKKRRRGRVIRGTAFRRAAARRRKVANPRRIRRANKKRVSTKRRKAALKGWRKRRRKAA